MSAGMRSGSGGQEAQGRTAAGHRPSSQASRQFRNLAMDAVDKMPVEVTGSEERIGPFCQPVLDGGGYS